MIFLKSHFFGTKEKPYFHWEIRLWWKVIIEKLGRVHYTFWILFGSYITCVTDHLQRNAMKHHLNDASKVRMFWKAEIKLFKSHSLGLLWKCRFHHEKFRWNERFTLQGAAHRIFTENMVTFGSSCSSSWRRNRADLAIAIERGGPNYP